MSSIVKSFVINFIALTYRIQAIEDAGCCNHILVSFNTSKGELDHGVKRHIGMYKKTRMMFEGHHTYVNAGSGFSTSYLFYNEGLGWRINQDLTSDFESVPAVVLRNCMNPCPALCTNAGDWWYRSDKKFPVTDSNIDIQCHLDNGSKMQQIVYKENDDGIFGNNIFIQVTSKRLERDPNLSTFASTANLPEDRRHILIVTINKAIISGVLILIICLLGLYVYIKNRKKCYSQSERKPLRHDTIDSTEMSPKVSACLENGAVETLISLLSHSDLQESQRSNGVHIYLHTNSQSPVSQDIEFFRPHIGTQDSDIYNQYPDYREGRLCEKNMNKPLAHGTDFKETVLPSHNLREADNPNDNDIMIRSHTNKVEKPERTSLSMPSLPLTADA